MHAPEPPAVQGSRHTSFALGAQQCPPLKWLDSDSSLAHPSDACSSMSGISYGPTSRHATAPMIHPVNQVSVLNVKGIIRIYCIPRTVKTNLTQHEHMCVTASPRNFISCICRLTVTHGHQALRIGTCRVYSRRRPLCNLFKRNCPFTRAG